MFSYHCVPNAITVVRLLLAPILAHFIMRQEFDTALCILLLAGISDGLDGWLARRWECATSLGAIMDPIADKVLMILTYSALWKTGIIPIIVFTCVVGRDVLMLLISFWIYFKKHSFPVHVTRMSKVNTFCQIVYAVTILALHSTLMAGRVLDGFLWGMAWLISLTTVCSGLEYAIYYGKWLRTDGRHEHNKRTQK